MSIFIGNSEIKNAYIGTTSVKEIYVGTTKVRPSTIGKSFDFTTQSKTALTNAGWVFQSNVVINSSGLYNGGSGTAYSYFPISKTASDVITIKVTFKGTNIGSWTGSLGTGFGGAGDYFYGTYKGLLTNSGYTFRWQWWTGGSAGTDISWSSNTWYVETLTFNLPSKSLTSKITTEANPSYVISNQTANISSYVSSIVSQQPGIYLRSDGVSRVKNISYEIS